MFHHRFSAPPSISRKVGPGILNSKKLNAEEPTLTIRTPQMNDDQTKGMSANYNADGRSVKTLASRLGSGVVVRNRTLQPAVIAVRTSIISDGCDSLAGSGRGYN
jgi:hypothetical protein